MAQSIDDHVRRYPVFSLFYSTGRHAMHETPGHNKSIQEHIEFIHLRGLAYSLSSSIV